MFVPVLQSVTFTEGRKPFRNSQQRHWQSASRTFTLPAETQSNVLIRENGQRHLCEIRPSSHAAGFEMSIVTAGSLRDYFAVLNSRGGSELDTLIFAVSGFIGSAWERYAWLHSQLRESCITLDYDDLVAWVVRIPPVRSQRCVEEPHASLLLDCWLVGGASRCRSSAGVSWEWTEDIPRSSYVDSLAVGSGVPRASQERSQTSRSPYCPSIMRLAVGLKLNSNQTAVGR